MELTIYTDCPTEVYFQPLKYLQDQNKLRLDVVDSRFLYLTYLKLKGKKYSHLRSGVLKSIFAPISLLFKKKIMLGFAPYSSAVYYLLLLKVLRKDLFFYTSWPHWGEKRGRHNFILNRLAWKLFLKNMKIVGVNKATTKNLDNVSVIPHAVNTDLFKPSKRNKKLNVLYVGRLEEEKGILDILRLVSEFKDVEFNIVGDGKLKKEVENSKANYLGKVWDRKKLAEIFGKNDIYILNSYKTKKWEEVFGLSALEAMSSGLAVISTDCVGPKEIIKDFENGLLIGQRNFKELKDKLELLVEDEKLREKLSKNARKNVLDNFDVKKISEKWEEFLR
jgi:glycosyltransferase involved in cell wall biosynthesis